MTINNYMSPAEAAYRWGIGHNKIKDRLKTRNLHALQPYIDEGLIKYFALPGAQRGEWIISKRLMEIWYDEEPKRQ